MIADGNLHFAYPLALQLYPLSIVVIGGWLGYYPATLLAWHVPYTALTRRRYRHPLLPQLALADQTATPRPLLARIKQGSAYLVLLGLIHLSLAQPYRYGQKIPTPPPQRDIVFVVDTSVSMLLRDYLVKGQRTERMTMLKSVLDHFIQQLAGNRIAVVAYSEQPYTVVPLSNDYALLRYQIQRLEPAVLTGRTSDLSLALLYSAQQFLSPGSEPPVLVLLTDATRPNRRIDPRAAARYVSAQHYRLHVVAIGAGSYAAQERDHVGLVYQPVNFSLLQEVAQAGQGRFFWAKDTQQLQQVLEEIQRAERRPLEAAAEFVQLPLYHWPLLLAVIWLCAWQLLPLWVRPG
ncbi:MAG: VWA domain-containing protein [Gammaproteobacteria bacterium]|nr:VWA domain-containing protein [Gammaproteobacteria bacterium]